MPAFFDLPDDFSVNAGRLGAIAFHHGGNIPFASKSLDVEHENFQFAKNIGRQKVPVDFNRDGRIFSFSGPGRVQPLNHTADQTGKRRNVDDA